MRYTTKRSIEDLLPLQKNLKIVVSGVIGHETPGDQYLWRSNGESITLSKRFAPRAEFIEYHNDMVFKGQGLDLCAFRAFLAKLS